MSAPIRVLLIAGYARSGSTLLARILGEVEGVVSPGELRHTWRRGFHDNRRCSCGSRFWDCPFWQAAATEAFGGMDALHIPSVLTLQSRVDHPLAIPQLLGVRTSARQRAAIERYTTLLSRLYQGLAAVTGAATIIDASKDPWHGYVLNALDASLTLSVVHLVRDSRAVAHSLRRVKYDPDTGGHLPRHSLLHTCGAWSVVNVLTDGLRRRVSSSMRVRYEDLLADPPAVVAQILRLVGIHPSSLPFRDRYRVRLGDGHLVAGNPMRFQTGEIELRADDAWLERLSSGRQAVARTVTYPLLRRYGFASTARLRSDGAGMDR